MHKIWLFALLATVLSFFLLSTHSAFAVESCQGIVRDQAGAVIPGVDISIFTGSINPTITKASTDENGQYSFQSVGFGSGSLATTKVEFTKDGYSTTTIDYTDETTSKSCPGIITLQSSSTTGGFGCTDQGQCEAAQSGGTYHKTYSDSPSCSADCGKFSINESTKSCIADTSGPFLSKSECEAQATGGGQCSTYTYSSTTNTCVRDQEPNCIGQSLTDCTKQVTTTTHSICSASDAQNCKIHTAIGDISADPTGLVQFFFGFLLSLAGGIALLLIIYSGYRIMTSQGNPEHLQGARETLTSAIIGLLFIIFSVVTLELIGVDVLHIPGFTH